MSMTVIYQEPYDSRTRGDRFGSTAGRPHPHRGQDWAPGNVAALAIADGVVAFTRGLAHSSVLGNVVVLKQADGLFSGYCHLATLPNLKPGTKIQRHASLGANLGATGSAARGRHLHLTLSTEEEGVFAGSVIDPLKYILAHLTAPHDKLTETEVKRLAKWLNKQGLGRTTTADDDGYPGANFWWLAQKAARREGIYPSQFDIDGEVGPKTLEVAHRLLKEI